MMRTQVLYPYVLICLAFAPAAMAEGKRLKCLGGPRILVSETFAVEYPGTYVLLENRNKRSVYARVFRDRGHETVRVEDKSVVRLPHSDTNPGKGIRCARKEGRLPEILRPLERERRG